MMTHLPRVVPPRRPRIPSPRPLRYRRRRGVFWLVVLVCVVLGVVGVLWTTWPNVGGVSQIQMHALTVELREAVAARHAAEAATQQSARRNSLLEAELEVLREDVERQERAQAVLRNELAFYQGLARTDDGDGLGVRGLRLQRTGQSGVWEVLFQIYRPGLNHSTDVRWSMEVQGRFEEDGEEVILGNEDLGVETENEIEGFRLLRHQRVRITLPEGFASESLRVGVESLDADGPEGAGEVGDWERMVGEAE